eukprot:scaffold7308_cov84-Skeletonema_marinoi.AAC.1
MVACTSSAGRSYRETSQHRTIKRWISSIPILVIILFRMLVAMLSTPRYVHLYSSANVFLRIQLLLRLASIAEIRLQATRAVLYGVLQEFKS